MTCPVCFKSHEDRVDECEVCKVCMENIHAVPASSLLNLARSKKVADDALTYENDRLRTTNLRLSEHCDYLKKAYDSFVDAWQSGKLEPYEPVK